MNQILIKRKLTTGAPTTAQLSIGEMCLVVPDNAIYWKKDASTIVGPIVVNPMTGDMLKSVYDANNNGRVDTSDNSLLLEGNNASYFTGYTDSAIAALVGAAPAALNTIVELATQMQADESGVTTLTALVGTKLDANSTIDGGSF